MTQLEYSTKVRSFQWEKFGSKSVLLLTIFQTKAKANTVLMGMSTSKLEPDILPLASSFEDLAMSFEKFEAWSIQETKCWELTVLFLCTSLVRHAISCAAVSLSNPLVHSSKMIISGSVTKPIATLSLLLSPPLIPLISFASSPMSVWAHLSSSYMVEHRDW